ncbi:UNVERIFIED_CONTAM: Kinesin-like protein KIN-7F [Sesamum calycinum]|uniref:Kinesin-like protein n=1 Tax=Sesamum calycinum TaxID=2727403 RepID=A0AAW2PAS0_9LAMI
MGGSIIGFGEDLVDWDGQDSSAQEEKIFVAVRVRPLNERELGKNDVSDWECINSTTIVFKNSLAERSLLPTAHTFDRVFGTEAPTRQVYEEAAKKIALSVLSGMNSTIFAYGQTSSGKTYTMTGITEYTHSEREFVLKFSAMEIYNEAVRDLLWPDGGPLRLLDDPERGTVVDKLTETVDSEAREYLGRDNSSVLTATVNFVDLAGSERASQTLSAGTRLKEGCHINRSLLTLGTVIRKLSKGRNGHIPYRDSKLTRILQNSLGGNARTAIICTMSPAHSHVEQSRNTLLFASCAKQVSTNAQVNLVMSEKALVKQLQRELARLENELRNLSSASASSSSSALKEKELLIEKMSKEIRELKHQRDLAQSRVENMLRAGENPASKSWVDMSNHEKGSWGDEYPTSEASEMTDPLRSDAVSRGSRLSDRHQGVISSRIEDNFPENNEEQFLSGDTSQDYTLIKIDFTKRNVVSSEPSSEKGDDHVSGQSPCLSDNNSPARGANVERCNSCSAILTTVTKSPSSDEAKENENTENDADSQEKLSDPEPVSNSENLDTEETQPSVKADFMNEGDCLDKQQEAPMKELNDEPQPQPQPQPEPEPLPVPEPEPEPVPSPEPEPEPEPVKQVEYDLDMKEERKPDDGKQTTDGGSDKSQGTEQSVSHWQTEFQRQKKEIIELWDACHTPLVHRTYFFLLFKGDPSDAVYLEVELRRLQFSRTRCREAQS